MYMPKACNLDDVRELKKHVDIPCILAGKFDNPVLAEEVISKGEIDMMGMGRPLLADPDIANKFYERLEDDIRPCICCHQGCLGRIFQSKDISCALNPACGKEVSYEIKPADTKKKIVIVGGGIGDMEAARVSALRGHEVHLYEATDKLGGVFVAAVAPDFKEDDRRLLKWYEKQIKDLNVNVHFNTRVDKAMLDELGYDELFIATGANERHLEIKGTKEGQVIYAIDSVLNDDFPGNNIVVIGGRLTGCEIAYAQAKKGKKVTVVENQKLLLTHLVY